MSEVRPASLNLRSSNCELQGVVEIFTAFNLNRVKRVRNSHSTFITGLEFLPTTEQGAICRAFKEASVVSISVDHQVNGEWKTKNSK